MPRIGLSQQLSDLIKLHDGRYEAFVERGRLIIGAVISFSERE